jgi:hypothetical protein
MQNGRFPRNVSGARRSLRAVRSLLEGLEPRLLLAANVHEYIWTNGSHNGLLFDAGNWEDSSGAPTMTPTNTLNDEFKLTFDGSTAAAATVTLTNVNGINNGANANPTVDSVTVANGATVTLHMAGVDFTTTGMLAGTGKRGRS